MWECPSKGQVKNLLHVFLNPRCTHQQLSRSLPILRGNRGSSAFILILCGPERDGGIIQGNRLLWAVSYVLPICGVAEDQGDHWLHLDSTGTLRNGSDLILERLNETADSARFMHCFLSMWAVYSGNKLFQRSCVTIKQGMSDVKTLQFFPSCPSGDLAGRDSTSKYKCGLFFSGTVWQRDRYRATEIW